MIAGQIALTAAAGALVWTLVWGFPWLPSTEPQRLAILGTGLTLGGASVGIKAHAEPKP
jgi:hypothetical protein